MGRAAGRVEADIQHQRDSKGYDYKRKRTTFQENTPFTIPNQATVLHSDLNSDLTKQTGSGTRANSKSK